MNELIAKSRAEIGRVKRPLQRLTYATQFRQCKYNLKNLLKTVN